jgi:predicted transcriptional regulator
MSDDLQKHTAELVSAFVSNNNVPVNELPGLIQNVYRSLANVNAVPSEATTASPAVSIKKSVTAAAING